MSEPKTPPAPIDVRGLRGAHRGYSGIDSDAQARLFAGPTKRSADVNDYTALEAEVAKRDEQITRLRVQLDAVLKRERALLWQVKKLEAVVAVDPDEIRLYVTARAARSTNITTKTSMAEIDAALEWQRRGIRIADLVAEAIAKVGSP